jgi:hypothetical protein
LAAKARENKRLEDGRLDNPIGAGGLTEAQPDRCLQPKAAGIPCRYSAF